MFYQRSIFSKKTRSLIHDRKPNRHFSSCTYIFKKIWYFLNPVPLLHSVKDAKTKEEEEEERKNE